jgi:mono/diheme cytochrome c family protein
MTKRTLTGALAILMMGGFACSSSSNNVPDGGDAKKDAPKSETGGDAPKAETGGDVASDAPTDMAAAETSGDAGSDTADAGDAGIVLTSQQLRGKYLVNNVIGCSDCHTPRKADGSPDFSKFLAGNADFIVMGTQKLPTRNLTNDPTGLKNRTDDQIKAMFMDGKRPTPTSVDGGTGIEALNPVMPYYVFHNMKIEDADAIVAYLRTVPGVNNEIPRRTAGFDVPAPATYIDPNKLPLPLATSPAIESALRGRYLAGESGLCVECHTKHNAPGMADVIDQSKFFTGGEDFSGFFAATLMIHPVSKNLTSDNTTGLGTWTVADIVNALKNGKAKDGTGICPPMPAGPMGPYGGLSDADATDIANYIKALPPVVNSVPDMCVFPPPPPDGGTSEAGADTGSDTGSSGDASGN